MCVWQRYVSVCVYCFVQSKWIGVYSCLFFYSHKFFLKKYCLGDQECLQSCGKETFISTQRILKLVRAVHCSSWQKKIPFLIHVTTFVRSIVGNISFTVFSLKQRPVIALFQTFSKGIHSYFFKRTFTYRHLRSAISVLCHPLSLSTGAVGD